MNKHSKIIVILLLAILISLGAAIVLFYVDVGKDIGNIEKETSVSEITDNSSHVDIFKDKNGLFGLKDSSGTIILDPEWTELESFDENFFKAKLTIRLGSFCGVIDKNGNIVVPFVYSEIKKISEYVYVANLNDTEEYMLYNRKFELILPTAADNYYFTGTNLCVINGDDKFTYEQSDELSLVKAEIPRFKRPITLNLTIEDPIVLSVADNTQLSSIGDSLISFLDMLRRNKTDGLSEIINSDSLSDITAIVEAEHNWKGKLSNNTYVYTAAAEEGGEVKIYFETELIILNEEDETENIALIIEFEKNEDGQWLICDISFE